MIDVSLTDFIDFIYKPGVSKFRKVNEIYSREPYQPAFDFWRPLREGIINYHIHGKNKNDLDQIQDGLTDANKIRLYPKLIKNYKSFLGRKRIEWFDPPYKDWRWGEFRMRLNPELGLEINGQLYVIKLYFKSEPLTKQKSDLIILLLNSTFKNGDWADVDFTVLDVGKKRFYESTRLTNKHIALLRGEALSFTNIWNSLEE